MGEKFVVAVIPMSDTVLFPGVTLSLHVMEKRQHEMLKAVEAKGIPIAVSLVVFRNKDRYTFNEICSTGIFQFAQECPDGHSDVLIHGKQRIKLCKVIQSDPFYLMEAEPLETETMLDSMVDSPTGSRSFEEFQALIKGWIFLNPDISDHWTLSFEPLKTFGELTDFFVYHFLKSPKEKQGYLNCTNPAERAEKLILFLERDLILLGRKTMNHRKFQLLH